MSVQPSAVPPAEEDVLAVAAEHQAVRNALTEATLSAILAVWEQVVITDLIGSWFNGGLGARIFVLLAASQESAAADAADYIDDAFDLIGEPIVRPNLIPETFAGIASDGRSLEGLLDGAPLLALQRLRRGESEAAAALAGKKYLTAITRTQIPDAGRAADQVAITAAIPAPRAPSAPSVSPVTAPTRPATKRRRKKRYGYVRMLNPPSCSRCVVLAGRFYRWSEGFQRHDMCDCVHIPAVEDVADDLTTDPKAYFDSLTREQQDEAFGIANAQAIRDGADMSQVVNATRNGGVFTADRGRRYTSIGTTRRGTFGGSGFARSKSGVLRPTPWQIYRDANGDADEARRLLAQFRYVLG